MKKPTILFLMTVVLIVAGMFLTYYGSKGITEDIAQQEFILGPNQFEEISVKLDPKTGGEGVLGVVASDFVEGIVSAKVMDPSDMQIFYRVIDNEEFEEIFTISTLGTHTLILENMGQTEYKVIGAIGHVPDSSKYAMSYSGGYLLIIGLVGMAGFAIYIVKNRKKRIS